MKCVEHKQDIPYEEFTGDVQWDIDPKVQVIYNTMTFQQLVTANYWSKIQYFEIGDLQLCSGNVWPF